MEILGVMSPGMAAVAEPKKSDPSLYKSLLPGTVAGIAGALAFENHRVLGFFAGEAVGLNAYRMYRGKGDDRRRAAGNLGMTAGLIAGSLMWESHPFWGAVSGLGVGIAATAMVKGTNANKLYQKVRGR